MPIAMSPGPTPTKPVASDADYARALEVDPALLAAPEEAPGEAEANATQVLRTYLAASHASPVPFPSIAMEILELVRYPDVDLNELSRYIRVDGALAGGVLALANSAIYRAVRRIDTIKEAVGRLGISEVARLAAAISMRSLYSADAAQAHQAFQSVWQRNFQHAVTVARCASELARQKVAPTPGVEQTFMAGLLHDVGLAAALRALAELVSYGKLASMEEPMLGRALHRVHVDAGVELHKGWQLPPTLSEVAAHHHGPVPPTELASMIHLVRMVSARDLLRRAPGSNPRGAIEVAESARVLGVAPERVKALAADLDAAEAWVATVFPA
jgi:putative nucleotidyltransferase with HDIG domain